jgi:hypothetical protein
MKDIWYDIINALDSFLFKEHHPQHVVYGQEYEIRKTLKTGNIALLISIITLILVIGYIIFHG